MTHEEEMAHMVTLGNLVVAHASDPCKADRDTGKFPPHYLVLNAKDEKFHIVCGAVSSIPIEYYCVGRLSLPLVQSGPTVVEYRRFAKLMQVAPRKAADKRAEREKQKEE